jgi:hypothetical protein
MNRPEQLMQDTIDQLSDEMVYLLKKYRMRPLINKETVIIDMDKSDHVSEAFATLCRDASTGRILLSDKKESVEPEVPFNRGACDKYGTERIGTFHTHPFPYEMSPSPMDVDGALRQDDLVSCTGAYDEEEGMCKLICFALDDKKMENLIMKKCADERVGDEEITKERCRDQFETAVWDNLLSDMSNIASEVEEDGFGKGSVPEGRYVYKKKGKIIGYIPYSGKTPASEEWDKRSLKFLERFSTVVVKNIPCD